MGISSKQVTMVTAQGEVWVAGVMQDQIVVTDNSYPLPLLGAPPYPLNSCISWKLV